MLWVCRGTSGTPDTRYGVLYVRYLLPQQSSGDFLFTEVVSPTPRSSLPHHEEFQVLVSIRSWVDPRTIVRPEGISKKKKSNDTIGNWTHNLPACSAVQQPTPPSSMPYTVINKLCCKFYELLRPTITTYSFQYVQLKRFPEIFLSS